MGIAVLTSAGRGIIDLVVIATAGGVELLRIWLSVMGALGFAPSSYQSKVVR